MLSPSRQLPRVGARARITHFGGGAEEVVLVAVREGGRRVEVRNEQDEAFEFVLSQATARFIAAGQGQGPRLELIDSE